MELVLFKLIPMLVHVPLQVPEGRSAKQKIFTYDAVYNTSYSHLEDSHRRKQLGYQSTVR